MFSAKRIALAAACFAAGAVAVPSGASAGPCSNEIAELARILSASPALSGTPTTGTLTGASPGNSPAPSAGGGSSAESPPDRTAGTSGTGRQGGTAGSREVNAAVGNQIATSPEDVRRQQQGLPTAAAAAESGRRAQSDRQGVEVVPGAPGGGAGPAPGGGERMERAKADLETARGLDARDDAACRDAINRVRQNIQGG